MSDSDKLAINLRDALPAICAKLTALHGAEWSAVQSVDDCYTPPRPLPSAGFKCADGLAFHLNGTAYLNELSGSPNVPDDSFGSRQNLRDLLPYADRAKGEIYPKFSAARLANPDKLAADIYRRLVKPIADVWSLACERLASQAELRREFDAAILSLQQEGWTRNNNGRDSRSAYMWKNGFAGLQVQPGGYVYIDNWTRSMSLSKALRIVQILATPDAESA